MTDEYLAERNKELCQLIREEKRETFGTGRKRNRYQQCHYLAAWAIPHAPEGTLLVQGADIAMEMPRQHSWLELPDGRIWDGVTCLFDSLDILAVAEKYTSQDVSRKIAETEYYGWWASDRWFGPLQLDYFRNIGVMK